MSDRTDAGDDERRAGGQGDQSFPPPFTGPFAPPFAPPFASPFTPPFTSPFGAFPGSFSPPFQAPQFPPFADWSRPFLEAQRSYLLWYRDRLQQLVGGEEGDDRWREALNALIASWLETVRALREQHEQAVRAQIESLTRYLDILDRLLEATGERRP